MTMRLPADCLRFVLPVIVLCASTLFAQEFPATEDGERFVSVGQLAKVNKHGKSNRFVLLDETGDVMASLRSAKGVQLSDFIGQEVGVTARTLVDGETPILLAESVTTFGDARQVSRDNIQKHIALASHEEEEYVASNSVLAPSPMLDEEYPVTSYSEPIIGPMEGDYIVPATSCGVDGCASCGGGCGRASCGSCAACPCGLPGRFWIRAEYLIWWTSGMDTPSLATTSTPGTARSNAGVLGLPGTTSLYGGDAPVFDSSRPGARFRIGKWCDQCNWIGFETEYWFLSEEDQDFKACDVGQTIYARPFFNANLNREDSELVQFPGVVNGSLAIDATTSIWSISPRLRVNLACEKFPGCNPCDPCSVGGYRMDLLVGYRYMQLEDSLTIREQLATIDVNDPTYFELRDSFDTSNEFHGADLGFLWEGYRGPWSLELIGRVGIGNTSQEVRIGGSTVTTTGGNAFNDSGGLLALGSNIGTYSRDEFTILPEASATLGYALSPRCRFLVGYTFVYWNNVVRAGEQIDMNINTDLLPPPQATTGENVPAFAFNDASYWAQGLSLGLEYRW